MATYPQDPTVRTLTAIPTLIGWLLSQKARAIVQQSPGGGSTLWEAPTPLNLDAFDDANRLWTTLLATTAAVAIRSGETAPGAAAWRDRAGYPVGLRSGTTSEHAQTDAEQLVRWLTARLGYLHEFDPALEAARIVAPKWPLRDARKTAHDAACPHCRGPIVITPPRHHLDEQTIACAMCLTSFTPEQLDEIRAQWFAVRVHETAKATGDAVARRLAKKYGVPA